MLFRKARERRAREDAERRAAPPPEDKDPRLGLPTRSPEETEWGICCSGGGVRSASYCLGALQVLREEGVLTRARYVSAVSGGSYIASAFATAASRLELDDPVPAFAPGSLEEEHLRNNSSYMAPDTASKARLGFRIVAGALWHMLLVAVLAAIVFWPLSQLYAQEWEQLAATEDGWVLQDLDRYVLLTAAVFALGLFCNFELWKADHRRDYAERLSTLTLLAGGLMLLVLVVIPQGVLAAREIGELPVPDLGDALVPGETAGRGDAAGWLGLVGGVSGLTSIAAALSTFVSQRRRVLLPVAAFVAGPLIVLLPALIVVDVGAARGIDWWIWAGLVAFIALVWLFLDMRQWSLHPFYERRLRSAFYRRSREEDCRSGGGLGDATSWQTLEERQPKRRDGIRGAGDRPFPRLLVCAAANVTEPGATPPGRAAVPFVFSGTHVGIPGGDPDAADADIQRLGRYPGGDRLTVSESVAMSGAAVSPMMGKKTIRAVRFLMALMNVRLGVWMPNTARAARHHWGGQRKFRRPRPHLLVKEALGLAKLSDPYVYVTDGGHFDNLGLIELLRRGCTTVFCLDGGGDPPGSFRALGEAIALARSELQVDVEIDPTPLTPDEETGLAPADHVLGTLRFRCAPDGSELPGDKTGRIIYCRSAVTKQAPWDVRDFANRDSRFPFHSTMDQLFTDEKFESYRALGGHTAREAVASWRRQRLREKVTKLLREHAQQKACIRYSELVENVRDDLDEIEMPTLRPLLDEIAAEEEAARRPPLVLLVQEGGPPRKLKAQIEQVYEYWQPLPKRTPALGNGG